MADESANESTWDVIVIGGGPPGENAAQYAIQGSDRTAAIVEHELLGGECSFWACMPSKALLRPVELVDAARSVAGVRVDGLDVPAVLKRRDEIIHHRDDTSQVDWARGTGIDVVRGHGRLAGARVVTVTAADGSTQTLHARRAVVVATGTDAVVPRVPGLREALPWISRDVTNLREVPRRVAIIGGGVVACEAAVWLRGLGAEEVTMIVRGEALLAKNEPFARALVAERFGELGIDVRFGASTQQVSRTDASDTGIGRVHGGPVELTVDGSTLVADEVLVAAGRTPSSGDIGLETVGLKPGGYLPTDDHMAVVGVEDDWLYAVGDATGKALLTHMGKYQGRICGAVIGALAEGRDVGGSRYRDIADHDQVPQVAFTDPEVASVGLTEAAARDRGIIDVGTVEYDLAALAGTYVLRDGYRGRAKLVIDNASDTLVGATFVGPEVAELVHAATVAIVGKVTLSTLWHAVPSYPTVSEIWLRLLEARGPDDSA
jgi:pyruvate/2-oxoglutarate dehydrogenase complex dihydrolipoamide dehydrogenase (E3) component